MRERVDVAKFLASIVALGVLVVGVPSALLAVSRSRFGSPNPLAGVDPWRFGGGTSLSQQIPDDTVIDGLIRLSLCVIWVAVVVIAITTVLEVAHMIRHRGLAMPSVRGIGWAQRIGRFIAVGLVVVIPLTSSTQSIARSLPPSAVERDAPATQQYTIASTSHAEAAGVPSVATAPTSTHVVKPGESILSIAERLAARNGLAARNDGTVIEIAASIVDANLGQSVGPGQRFTNPAYIEAGWTLQIPASLVTAGPADVAPSVVETYVVEPGDTLWDIADERFGDATEWPLIWAVNAGQDMGGGRTFDDPDLILPGWELDLPGASAEPAVDADVADVIGAPVPAAPVAPTAPTADTAPIEPPPTPTAPAAAPTVTPAGVVPTTIAATDPSTPTTPAPTTTTPSVVGGGQSGSVDDAPLPAPRAPSPLRIEHAALLAAGVLALVAVRRRQRLRAAMPRHRVPEPRRDVVETERRLRAIDAGERAMRVDVACRASAWSLIGTGVQIGWVEVTTDGDVGLRLTGLASLPAPWTGEGADWWLAADVPVELLSDDARRVGMPCVAFVQIGVTPTGAEVLVDLEACATLAIDARPDQADEVLAALAAGLASSMYAEVAHLIGVSMPRAAFLGHRNAHVVGSAAEAFELATSMVGSTLGNDRTAFELRSLRTGGEMWEPAIVLLGAGEHEVATVTVGGHGLGIVVPVARGVLADAPTRLIGMADSWCFVGFGSEIELTPVGLTAGDLTAIDDVLADADRALQSIELDDIRWADVATSTVIDVSDEPDGSSTDDSPDDDEPATHENEPTPFEPRPHQIVVRLLGAVEVADAAGARGSFERSKTVELIAWLATHRERATRTGARTALWELDVRDATFANVVSEARRGLARLVAPPDGEEWVARTLTEQLPLHEAVVTDADLVTERLAHARLQPPTQALHTLRPAVETIRDMPFAGTSYLWPDAEGITSNLVLLAITAAAEYAGHALSLGDTDGVFWATGRGLHVLPGHEELIGLRMRAHARAGDLAGVRQEWESYERVLVADAWSDGEPAPKLLALRRELLSST